MKALQVPGCRGLDLQGMPRLKSAPRRTMHWHLGQVAAGGVPIRDGTSCFFSTTFTFVLPGTSDPWALSLQVLPCAF